MTHFDPESRENWPNQNPNVQEALSRRYSDDIIMLLPIKSGEIAVFNSARELCGFAHPPDVWSTVNPSFFWDEIRFSVWHPPKPAPAQTKPDVDLKDLELL